MREPEWLAGKMKDSAFSLQPHAEMLQELIGYFSGPRRAIVKPQGSEQAPSSLPHSLACSLAHVAAL